MYCLYEWQVSAETEQRQVRGLHVAVQSSQAGGNDEALFRFDLLVSLPVQTTTHPQIPKPLCPLSFRGLSVAELPMRICGPPIPAVESECER